ncbi:testis-expressed protein 2-like [Mercenaria mercenaria]|uniref:testis-expressed protein 2-like n=1 Tax=Mercenaria mercenaria TaxID=6596 RepID=UPI00234F3FE3|nr:testis-expressed protein 2-like [Mercenaria mercenaria]
MYVQHYVIKETEYKMSKKTSPPPRPPAPKVGGGSMSFSFKALEEEDEEELTFVTGRKFDKQVHEEKERHARSLERERSVSKSPETRPTIEEHMEKSPSIKSQNSFEKLKDFKDKIQSEIQKKKDEMFTDSTVSSPATKDKQRVTVIKEKTLPLGNMPETVRGEVESFEESGEFESVNEQDTNDDTDFFETKSDEKDDSAPFADAELDDHLEINEEYFKSTEEDFSDLPGVVPMVRQRKRFQKHRKIKPVVPVAPVSMVKLSQKVPEDEIVPSKLASAQNQNDKKDEVNSDINAESGINIHGTKVQMKSVFGGVIILFLFFIIPLPSYLSGMVIGMVLSSAGWMLYLWVNKPAKPREPIPEDPPLDKLPPMLVPEMKEPKGEDCVYKGWMNEILDYQPETYSINNTHSVYVHLDGTTLRLRRPKVNMPRRAMWDEPSSNPQFIHQRHYDIVGSKVLLLPSGLVKKRLWSKKYPLCIALANDGKKQSVKPETSSVSGSNGNQSAGKLSTSNSADSVQGFEMVNEQKCDSSVLFLFARTCREKEQWYRRLVAATNGTPLKNHIREVKRLIESSKSSSYKRSSSTDSLRHKSQNSSDSISSISTTASNVDDSGETDLKNFVMYMSRLIPRDKDSSLPSSPVHGVSGKDKDMKHSDSKSSIAGSPGSKGVVCEPVLLPLNALLARCFWDFLGDQYWANKVKEKLQKKLSKIHIPYFIEELQIGEISLGSEVPVIRRANKPYLDENGFWIDVDVTYSGKFKMTIETKVNLLKLKSPAASNTESKKTKRSAITDSEEEDSAESSTDEEDEPTNLADDGSGQSGGTGKKIMKYINKIAASKYFQSATENKYIKKAMTGVSNTPLILTVEVQKLSGTLAVNIPPPPSDRLWYGFRGNPQLWLVAKPKVGEREVTMSHITDWIEKKLAMEFQHVFVMPNMDDLVIPILMPGVEVDAATTDVPHSENDF